VLWDVVSWLVLDGAERAIPMQDGVDWLSWNFQKSWRTKIVHKS